MRKFWGLLWRHIWRWVREPRIIWRAQGPTLRVSVEIQSWLPLAVFLIALGWYIAAPSPVAVMTMLALGGILAVAYLWALTMARSVHGRRGLRYSAMQVGDEIEEQVSLRNESRLPVLWAEFLDRSNIPGYTVSSARAADPTSQVDWRVHTVCTRRGVFKLGPWELRLGEPMGIFLVRQVYLQRQEILVYPPLAVLPASLLPHHGALGDSRPLNQPLRAETIASTTVRPYHPGDPLRHIHWRTSARREDPYVKVFAPEAASSIWLVPDFDAAAHSGEGPESSEEMMVTVISSLAAALLQKNLSVGLFASAEQEAVVLPRQGQGHLWPVLQAIAPLHAVPRRSLEDVLTRAKALVSGSDLLVVVTPSLRPDWIAPLRRLARSRGSSARAEVVLLAPASAGGKNDAGEFLSLLLEQGITASLLHREDIQVISGYYGEVSRWEFTAFGTGRVVMRKSPRLAEALAGNAQQSPWGSPEA